MIVKPTVKDLLEHAENRYALVIATSRRARQIAQGDMALTEVDEKSPVTIAANEIAEGMVEICEQERKKVIDYNMEEDFEMGMDGEFMQQEDLVGELEELEEEKNIEE